MCRFLRRAIPVSLLLMCLSTYAQPPSRDVVQQRAPSAIDNDSWIDANNILMFVSNYGALAHDFGTVFGRSDGLYFPFTGIADINSGTNDKTVLYQAGLWIGGKVGGLVRVTVSEFSSEFYPGPMVGGTYIDGTYFDPQYRVYYLYSDSLEGNPGSDYLIWPIDQGAPYDIDGVDTVPAMLGDQMLWTVFNDAKADEHETDAGRTAPMGIEVRQTVWASNDPGEESVVYVKYLLFNKGSNTITDCHLSFWCDPDLGAAGDDYVGCDSARDIAFCYNSTNLDSRYGDRPPAVGVRLISGPVVSSPGDVAEFDGQPLPSYRNLHMCSFNKFINGTDPDDAIESYSYMRGLDKSGGVIIDPYTSLPSKFVCSGDPASGTGWLDANASDRRFMFSTGPFTFAAGDSQQAVFKIGAAQGPNRIESVDEMKQLLDSTYHSIPLTVVAADSAVVKVKDNYHLHEVWFEPESQQWLGGLDWGGDFYDGSADIGEEFLGSAINPTTHPALFSNVEVRFSPTTKQRAYLYLRGSSHVNYECFGYFEVPFQVWDIDHDRQLNAACVEYVGSTVYDSTWGPSDISDNLGGREYLFVLASDYSGDNEMDADPEYTSKVIADDAPTMDILYFMWPVLAEGHTLDELDNGQILRFDIQDLNTDPRPSIMYFEDAPVGEASYQDVAIESFSQGISAATIYTDDPAQYTASPDAYHFQLHEEFELRITFHPLAEGLISGTLYVADSVSGAVLTSVGLSGTGVASACCQGNRRGDVDCSYDEPYEIDSTDLGTLVNYLFSPPGTLILCCPDEADADGMGGPFPIDSTDLGTLVNLLFSPPGSVVIPACP